MAFKKPRATKLLALTAAVYVRVIRKSQLGKLSRNSHYVTFFFIFLVSSKVEFLLNKELCTLFYFYQAGYTNVDRCLMRYFIRYN